MEYLYTEGFKNILRCAEEEKNLLNHPYVGTEHLLLSFLKNKNNNYTKKMHNVGLSYNLFKNGLIKYIGIGNKNIDYLLYTPLLRNIINNSFKFTDNNFIDENDLFISFCYSEVGIAKSILKNMNIDLFKIFKL